MLLKLQIGSNGRNGALHRRYTMANLPLETVMRFRDLMTKAIATAPNGVALLVFNHQVTWIVVETGLTIVVPVSVRITVAVCAFVMVIK